MRHCVLKDPQPAKAAAPAEDPVSKHEGLWIIQPEREGKREMKYPETEVR